MSLLARSSSLHAISRLARPLATNAPAGSPYFAQLNALREHAAHTSDLWRKISFYVAFPATFVTCAWVYNVESEHAAHEEPLIEENNGTLPQPPPYAYLNRRVKPFPWGSNSLFFHPKYNKDMDNADDDVTSCPVIPKGSERWRTTTEYSSNKTFKIGTK